MHSLLSRRINTLQLHATTAAAAARRQRGRDSDGEPERSRGACVSGDVTPRLPRWVHRRALWLLHWRRQQTAARLACSHVSSGSNAGSGDVTATATGTPTLGLSIHASQQQQQHSVASGTSGAFAAFQRPMSRLPLGSAAAAARLPPRQQAQQGSDNNGNDNMQQQQRLPQPRQR